MKGFLLGFLRGLKWPVKVLVGLFRKRRKRVINKREQNQRKHVRNFDPSRLKNMSWQKSDKKGKKLRSKRRKKGKFSKKTNKWN